jgi:PAS domain S-box-containing protein
MNNLKGANPMLFLDYIINLSIFSLMVSTPLVIRSFFNLKPLKYFKLIGGIYAGIVSMVLTTLSIQHQGFSYDIRYAPVILAFVYLGPLGGFITGSFALTARLIGSENWMPAIIGWMIIAVVFVIIHQYKSHLTTLQKCFIYSGSYVVIYFITVPLLFRIIRDNPMFHLEYLLFVLLGVFIGVMLIESYEKLYRLNTKYSDLYKMNVNYQQELTSTLNTLEESEAKYRLIAENTSDLIMVMDSEHSISYFSPSHHILLGYDEAELAQVELCKFIHPDDVLFFKNTIEKIIATKQFQSMEFRFKHKRGDWINFESRCMPVKGENDSIEHIVMISRDISERKRAEEFLIQSEKLSIVGELAAGVAHEIRNPLTTIKGFIQLYKKQNHSAEYNDLLLSELDRIETITTEMLSLGKPQAIQLKTTNLGELIEETLDLLQPQAHMNGIQFKLLMGDETILITCERNQIKQVFLNILKNAMEAMNSGGNIYINLRKCEDDKCMISFQDQGSGIPEELLPRLGEPFYSLKEKGTGLGLMICHKIIKQHQGNISYHSVVNKGTLVEILLPLETKETRP